MAEGKAAAAIARLGQIGRELADRRALRERNAKAAQQRAADALQRQGQVAERAAKHLGELGRRQREAGGWATQKSMTRREYVLDFEPEDEERAAELAEPGTAAPTGSRPYPAGPVPEPQAPAQPPQRKHSRSVAPPQAAEPEQSPPAAPRRAPRHAREDRPFDDDDDFSNHSWLR